jgi:hypothetical protein
MWSKQGERWRATKMIFPPHNFVVDRLNVKWNIAIYVEFHSDDLKIVLMKIINLFWPKLVQS